MSPNPKSSDFNPGQFTFPPRHHPPAGSDRDADATKPSPTTLESLDPPAAKRTNELPKGTAQARVPRAEDFDTFPTFETVLDALAGRELYQGERRGDKLLITCPWAAEHPEASSSQAAYDYFGVKNPFGEFRCAYEHTPPRDVMDLMDHLGILDSLRGGRRVSASSNVGGEAGRGSISDQSERDGKATAIASATAANAEPLPDAPNERGESGGLSQPAPLSPPLPPRDCEPTLASPPLATSKGADVRPAPGPTPELVVGAKPRIEVLPGQSHRAADEAERLLAEDPTYFHADGRIIRVVTKPGSVVESETLNEYTLSALLASKGDWRNRDRGGDVPCDPPHKVMKILMHRQDRPYLLVLRGIAHNPYYGPRGRLITSPGYDTETGILAVFDEEAYRPYPPTPEMAGRALSYLKSLLCEFPFATPADQSAALSALITAVGRPGLNQSPGYNINGTQPGSGKSLLGDVICAVATPGRVYKTSYPPTEAEATKAVLAALLERPSVIYFDDMQSNWRSFGPINRMLTSEATTERVLGFNRTATASTKVLILGTGNNVEPERDMRRRIVSIRLTPEGDSPALRVFAGDPLDEVKKRRAHTVLCALTIIEAYRAAGQPRIDVKPVAGFGEWSAFARYPLLWLGEPDPATSLIAQLTQDDDQDLLGEFLSLWYLHLGPAPITVRTMLGRATEIPDLLEMLSELGLVEANPTSNGKLGWYLRKNCGRRANGLQIERGPVTERRTWRLVGAGPTTTPATQSRTRARLGR